MSHSRLSPDRLARQAILALVTALLKLYLVPAELG